ncbi:uncharacterized protein LOC117583443 [Drosophila guanche]|uniref:Myb/SANT-like DNA-binding domain-containing protein n=1 Tax=Drosophila guanche TaxID=7266 RepID=A0A3B0K670_DROGU|nr:uncharacterized protein LOC117583443 [Drosophila guanche]SPP81116.1 Hypothetical predicted protein [Drosophila guanche]
MSNLAHKRKWLPAEEDTFIRIWSENLDLYRSGKKQMEVCRLLEDEFRYEGIEINALGIKTKMDSFKRKFFNIARGDEKLQTRKWRHYKTLDTIFGSQLKELEESGDSNEPVPKQSRKSRSSKTNNADQPFNLVYVDELNGLLLDEEDCTPPSSSTSEIYQEPPVKKKKRSVVEQEPPAKQQKSNNAAHSKQSGANSKPRSQYTKAGKLRQPKRPRRNWTIEEEVQFIEVWKNYVGDLLGEGKKKADIYRAMKKELQSHGVGLDKIASDFKAKVESLKRVFKSEHETYGAKSEWIHYAKLVDVVGPLNGILIETHNDSSSSSDDWFRNETKPESPSQFPDPLEEQQEQEANESDSGSFCWVLDNSTEEAAPSNQFLDPTLPDDEYSPVHSPVQSSQISELNDADDNDSDNPKDYVPDFEEKEEAPQELDDIPSRQKKKSVEQFTNFVAKELLVLNDDLLLEAKRHIYDVLCKMEHKRLLLNKKT